MSRPGKGAARQIACICLPALLVSTPLAPAVPAAAHAGKVDVAALFALLDARTPGARGAVTIDSKAHGIGPGGDSQGGSGAGHPAWSVTPDAAPVPRPPGPAPGGDVVPGGATGPSPGAIADSAGPPGNGGAVSFVPPPGGIAVPGGPVGVVPPGSPGGPSGPPGAPVPEPFSWALLLLGTALVGARLRQRRTANAPA